MEFLGPAKPIVDFENLNLKPEYLAALKKMGVSLPTPIQSLGLPTALSGVDLLTVGPTGSGKTLVFVLSILSALQKKAEARALILVPSREMAMQIHRVFEALWELAPLKSCVVIGGEPGNKQNSQMKKLPRVVVATPGRLNDLLTDNKLLLRGVEILVIDEADRMLDLGFGPQLQSIKSTMRGSWQTQLYSASFGLNLDNVTKIFMRDQMALVRVEDSERAVATLSQKILFMTAGMKNQRLQDEINLTKKSVIVFTADQENCEKVGNYLAEYAHSVEYVHGALSQGHRSRVLRDFRDGRVRILVATDLMARGIDVASVDLVVNYDLPPMPEDFLHRIGRTARVGREGVAVSFVTPFDSRAYQILKAHWDPANEVSLVANFSFVGGPAEASKARHQQLPRVGESAKKAGLAAQGNLPKKKKFGKLKSKAKA